MIAVEAMKEAMMYGGGSFQHSALGSGEVVQDGGCVDTRVAFKR